MSPFDDGWLLDTLAAEIRFNDPRTESLKESDKKRAEEERKNASQRTRVGGANG